MLLLTVVLDTNTGFSRQLDPWVMSFISAAHSSPRSDEHGANTFGLHPSASRHLFFKLLTIWKLFWWCRKFPKTTVIKYYKLGGLKQHKFVVSHFWMSPKSRCWQAGLAPSEGS